MWSINRKPAWMCDRGCGLPVILWILRVDMGSRKPKKKYNGIIQESSGYIQWCDVVAFLCNAKINVKKEGKDRGFSIKWNSLSHEESKGEKDITLAVHRSQTIPTPAFFYRYMSQNYIPQWYGV